MALILHGTSSVSVHAFGVWPTSVPMPTEAQSGDLVVVTSGREDQIIDSRFTALTSRVSIGRPTTLEAISLLGGGVDHQQVAVAAFANRATGTVATDEDWTINDPFTIANVPAVGGPSAIACTATGHSVVHGIAPIPAGYEEAINTAGIVPVGIFYWNTDGSATSPASNPQAGVFGWATVVIAADGGGLLTVRKYPVDRGRGWPPPRDRSRGRRVGGYQ